MKKPSYLSLKLSVLALVLLFLAVWVLFDLGCPIRHVTGVICPGCGMGRAWLSALRLDMAGALRFHPMFWVVPVVALFGMYDFQLIPVRWLNILVLAALGLGVTVCYLLRLTAFLHGNLAV